MIYGQAGFECIKKQKLAYTKNPADLTNRRGFFILGRLAMEKLEVSKCFLPKDVFDEFMNMAKEDKQKWGRKPKPITKLVWPNDKEIMVDVA